ncbi:putative B3 domain-containing protein-like [Capsicum annuum]|nr:putative B3 domain-containing protein-like [Capsicum annuum]KAF3651878.1 putative B3 domain-containing protein-like [Capsicum annuum]
MRVQLLALTAVLVLSFIAEKCRQLIGEESASRSKTERFTFVNCFDMSYGTIGCILKELVKIYLYYIRATHVHKVRNEATKEAVQENLSKGQSLEDAVKEGQKVGNAAARRASLQAKHIMGPMVSSGWDFFETVYVGGTLAEASIRSVGTLLGSYVGGIIGEGKTRWFGFLLGSQLGSWIGGRLGLMLYDVGNGLQFVLQLTRTNKSDGENNSLLLISS